MRCLFLILLLSLAGPVGAAITVLGGTVKTGNGPDTLNLKANSSTGSTDLLIAQIIAKSDATIVVPAGWTKITAASTSAGGLQQQLYYQASAGDSDGNRTHPFRINNTAAGNSSAGVILSLAGASTTSPVCGTGLQSGGGNQITAPNVQTQPPTCPAGSLRMAFFATNNGSLDVTLPPPATATAGPANRAGAGTTGVGLFSSYYVMASASNGGSLGASIDNPGTNNIGATVIINEGAAASIDHLRLELAASPLTCTPASVTVKACANSNCTALASTATTVTLSTTGGSWASSPLTFTGSTTTSLAVRTTSAVTLGASSNPAATNATRCYVGGVQATGCSVSFADSGLLLTIPAQTAGVTSSGATRFSVAAVRKSDNGLNCTPAFANVTRSVKFWTTYSNPASGTRTLAVQGTTVATASPGTAVSLAFDSTGTATGLTLNYADAGQLTLNARYDGSAGTSDSGLVMTGSAAFVTVPYALCVDSPDANWGCTAANTTCTKFTSAGSAFNLRVTGKAFQAATATCSLPTTPNYVQSGIALSSALVAPSGGVNATLSPTTISVSSGGTATNASQTVSEVGVFTITATPPAGAYFGLYTVPAGTSANSGRFVPFGFSVGSNTINDRSDINTSTAIGGAESCSSSFTYLGEPARALFTLTALNASGVRTQNYTGSFARLSMTPVSTQGSAGLLFGAQAGGALLNSRLTASCASCGAFSAGVANLAADLTVRRSTGTTVDGPYTASYGLVALDADSVGMYTPGYNWDLAGAAEGGTLGSASLYFGRMRVDSAYGSALQALPVPTYAQYWTGSVFAKADGQSGRPNDSCTRLTVPASTTITAGTAAALYCSGGVGLYGTLAGVAATYNGITAGNTATLSAGDANVRLSAPSNAGGGYLDFAPLVPDYLRFNQDGIDQSGGACAAVADGYFHDDNPRVRIRFGARRDSAVIYSREVY